MSEWLDKLGRMAALVVGRGIFGAFTGIVHNLVFVQNSKTLEEATYWTLVFACIGFAQGVVDCFKEHVPTTAAKHDGFVTAFVKDFVGV